MKSLVSMGKTTSILRQYRRIEGYPGAGARWTYERSMASDPPGIIAHVHEPPASDLLPTGSKRQPQFVEVKIELAIQSGNLESY